MNFQNSIDEDENSNNINYPISNFINSINLNNLNDYYDIETSIFKKKCEKLNLKFYYESEALSSQKEIPYPYNKLFIILFKEISLYIEEIERLNKQLRQKNKNEKYYQEKLSEYLLKEKEVMLNKQKLKNAQKTNKILEKKELKLRGEIEKLQHKININNNINISNSIVNSSFIGGSTTLSTNVNTKNYKKKNSNNFRNSHSIDNKNNYEYKKGISDGLNNNEMNKELYEKCIKEYDDELNYLNNFQKILEERKKDIEKKINS